MTTPIESNNTSESLSVTAVDKQISVANQNLLMLVGTACVGCILLTSVIFLINNPRALEFPKAVLELFK